MKWVITASLVFMLSSLMLFISLDGIAVQWAHAHAAPPQKHIPGINHLQCVQTDTDFVQAHLMRPNYSTLCNAFLFH